jgi:hypothetical protein
VFIAETVVLRPAIAGMSFWQSANVDLVRGRCYDHAVRLELSIIQHFRCILRGASLVLVLGFCSVISSNAQSQKPNLPNPIKFIQKYDVVANVVREVLDGMGFKIELEDRQAGRIVTKPFEFISGSLTSSEVEKVAIPRDAITGNLLKARYSVEAILEIVSPAETMVTVHTKIEALSKDVDGTEKWVPYDSLGTYERRILGKISTMLMSNKPAQEEEKGFWNQKPRPVNPSQPRLPNTPR